MVIYLVSYRPLCFNAQGRQSSEMHDQPKFADHSTRREPALESPYPGISAICRAGNFAPRLQEGDTIVYITVQGRHLSINKDHWCLVAILRVIKRCRSHQEAELWYREKGLTVPNNCLVEGSEPLPKHLTALSCYIEKVYRERAIENPDYLICEPEYVNLKIPRPIFKSDWQRICGRVPPTETPTTINQQQKDLLYANK